MHKHHPATGQYVADFNGDGHKDLALGDPDDSTQAGVAGAVHLRYGAAAGSTAEAVTLTQNSASVPGSAETKDFDGLVTALKGSACGITTSGATTSGATTYGPSTVGISTGDDPRLGMITAG